jgi:hypothetical protein
LHTRPTSTDITKLSMTKLEKLFATHAKDERNVQLTHRKRNYAVTAAIMDELVARSKASTDEIIELRYAKALLRSLQRTIRAVEKYGPVLRRTRSS